MKAIIFALGLFFVFGIACLPAAEEGTEEEFKEKSGQDAAGKSKPPTVQKVSGLLFDMDEGVKIEEGAGGSVYVHSNREAVSSRFRDIEYRLEKVEKRLDRYERDLKEEETVKLLVRDSGKR